MSQVPTQDIKNDGDTTTINSDEAQLNAFGYKQTLHRSWKQFEAFQIVFGGLYFIGGVRYLYAYGVYSGGPAALWSSMLITCIMMCITAASLAEICSAMPLSGSIYTWASVAGGLRYGRLVGFVVAFWVCTAWTTFVASNSQGAANFILSEMAVFEIDFPAGDPLNDGNVRFRAVVWIVSEACLLIAVLVNYLPPTTYRIVFRASLSIILLDFVLNYVWLPVGIATRGQGFQTAEWVFTQGFNGTGAPPAWNWILSFVSTGAVLTGFDAAGHTAEETQQASIKAARGIFWGCAVSALFAFPTLLLFLFCSPSLDDLFALAAPQPFVLLYQRALGTPGQIILTVVAIIGLIINTIIAIVAASRLVFAVARDGVLPGSSWIGRVSEDGQPRNAVTFIGIVAAILLCAILPSSVAFTSLVSAASLPTICAYGLIALLRLTVTRGRFGNASWSLGRWSEPACVVSVLWCAWLTATFISPYQFPVTAETLNFAPVILGAVTIIALVFYCITPEDRWLPKDDIARVLDAASQPLKKA